MKIKVTDRVSIDFITVKNGNGVLIIVDGKPRKDIYKVETLLKIADVLKMDKKSREVLYGEEND